jgi:hypothetical protein
VALEKGRSGSRNPSVCNIVIGQVEEVEEFAAAALHQPPIQMMKTRDELEVLVRGEIVVEDRRFWFVADAALGFERLLDDVEPADGGAAARRPDQPGEHLDRRGFPRAVWPEEPEDLSRFHPEGEIDHRDLAAIGSPQVLRDNHARILTADGALEREEPGGVPSAGHGGRGKLEVALVGGVV